MGYSFGFVMGYWAACRDMQWKNFLEIIMPSGNYAKNLYFLVKKFCYPPIPTLHKNREISRIITENIPNIYYTTNTLHCHVLYPCLLLKRDTKEALQKNR